MPQPSLSQIWNSPGHLQLGSRLKEFAQAASFEAKGTSNISWSSCCERARQRRRTMKSLLVSTMVALVIAATPALAQQKAEHVRVTVQNVTGVPNGPVEVPIGIAAQVCGKSASEIAKNRNNLNCIVTQPHVTKAFLNFVTKSKS
jgi:hypothetical protein